MRIMGGNAGLGFSFFVSFVFAVIAFAAPASAQNFAARSEAQFALLGPRVESGIIWEVERQRDAALCALTQDQIRQKLRKSSSAVVAAAFEILREARARCGGKYDYIGGFYASVGVGGSFSLDQSTTTQNIASAGVYDPVDAASRKVGLGISGVIGQVGIGYDWQVGNLFSPSKLGPGGGFVGIKADVTFGGGDKTINGIPGVVPFIPAGVAMMDTLRFRSDYSIDLTARIGTYLTPQTAVYALGGLSLSQISLKYDCAANGFCGVAPATPAFSSETTKWATGAVLGAGIETKPDWLRISGLSLYLEYRAHLMDRVTLDVGSVATRSTAQEVDLSYQSVLGGARIRF